MLTRTVVCLLIIGLLAIAAGGCNGTNCCPVKTKTIHIYENHTINANMGISTGTYTNVDGFRYVNIVCIFSQKNIDEEPVSLGVKFSLDERGKLSSRRYFTFEENFEAPADPQMITCTGAGSFHGTQQGISSYIIRLPIMGPYIQVFPFNHHDSARTINVSMYLTE